MRYRFLFLIFSAMLMSGCFFSSLSTVSPVQMTQSSSIQLHTSTAQVKKINYQWLNVAGVNQSLRPAIRRAIHSADYQFVASMQRSDIQLKITQQQVGLATAEQLAQLKQSDFGVAPVKNLMAVSEGLVTRTDDADVINVSQLTPVVVVDLQISEPTAFENNQAVAWNRYQTRFIAYAAKPSINFQVVQQRLNQKIALSVVQILRGGENGTD